MKRIILPLLFVVLLTYSGAAQSITGRVVTIEGKPVPNAVVQPSGMLFSATTKEDGTFNLNDSRMKYFWIPDERKLVFVSAKGFDTSVSIVAKGQITLEITLASSKSSVPSISDCREIAPKEFSAAGTFVRILFPKNLKIKKKSNFEYSGFELTVKDGSGNAVLHNWTGVYPTTYAPTHLILDSSDYSVVSNGIALDWRGRLKDGTYWRYIGGYTGSIDSFSYETKSESLAGQLNKILTTKCVRI